MLLSVGTAGPELNGLKQSLYLRLGEDFVAGGCTDDVDPVAVDVGVVGTVVGVGYSEVNGDSGMRSRPSRQCL